ncbi:MAG: mechanosensitive ion channel family protein [Pseudolabrys sp.]|nr:mechanosensitive ion channel family protein [Pseudolabrys sp.]
MTAALQTVQQKLDGWFTGFFFLLPNLIAGLIVAAIFVAAAFGVAQLLRQAVMRAGRRDLGHMLASFAFWAVIFLGGLVVMTIVLPSMQPGDIFTSLGIGSVAIGFAFKDILQNWLAGIFILIRRPFRRGDQIKIGDVEGTVQAVETRATLVKTYSGRLVIIPNAEVYTKTVTVNTAYDLRRAEVMVPVGLEVDLEQAMDVFRKAVLSVEHVVDDPSPDILPWEFADNNVNIRVRWWMKSQRTYEVRTRAAVVLAIKTMSESSGIALPADTKISFATTPLIVAHQEKEKQKSKRASAKPKGAKPSIPPHDATKTEAALPDTHDVVRDPEAEKPKHGELNEGAVPR